LAENTIKLKAEADWLFLVHSRIIGPCLKKDSGGVVHNPPTRVALTRPVVAARTSRDGRPLLSALATAGVNQRTSERFLKREFLCLRPKA
jgi:hypothetical protein